MSYNLNTPFSNQVIFLDTDNAILRSIDGGDTEYQYNFQSPIQVPHNCLLLLSITDAQLPNIMPNVSSTNNKISFFIPTFSKYFTITIIDDDGTVNKNYNVNNFLSYINGKILTETNDQFTLYGYYDENNAKLIWYCNYPFQIIDTTSYPTTCLGLIGGKRTNNNEFDYVDLENGIILNSVVAPSYHITMPSVVNFSNTRFIFLKFKNITVPNLDSKGLNDNAVVRITNNAPFGYYIFYKPNEVQRFLITKKTISNIAFRLTDIDGNDINIWSSNAQITIKLETIYKPELRNVEEGTIIYELRKLNKNFPTDKEFEGSYNPETNQFVRD